MFLDKAHRKIRTITYTAYVEFVVEEQRRIKAFYSMSIASPKEKNLYFSLTAVS